MNRVDEACREVVAGLEGAVACGVVDLASGMLIGVHVAPAYPAELDSMVTRAALDLFRATNVDRIERLIRSRRDPDAASGPVFQEVHITSDECFHFAKVINDGKAAIVLVTLKWINQGLCWTQLKSALPKIEPHVR